MSRKPDSSVARATRLTRTALISETTMVNECATWLYLREITANTKTRAVNIGAVIGAKSIQMDSFEVILIVVVTMGASCSQSMEFSTHYMSHFGADKQHG